MGKLHLPHRSRLVEQLTRKNSAPRQFPTCRHLVDGRRHYIASFSFSLPSHAEQCAVFRYLSRSHGLYVRFLSLSLWFTRSTSQYFQKQQLTLWGTLMYLFFSVFPTIVQYFCTLFRFLDGSIKFCETLYGKNVEYLFIHTHAVLNNSDAKKNVLSRINLAIIFDRSVQLLCVFF